MKRLHVHIAVDDLMQSVAFYSTLFSTEPTVVKSDYAKWMLDDPRVNLAISQRGAKAGVEHLGIQVETGDELADVYERLSRADASVLDEGETTCCYAKSEKSWISDPSGVAWEVFYTTGDSAVYGGGPDISDGRRTSTPTGMAVQRACCPVPVTAPAPSSCC